MTFNSLSYFIFLPIVFVTFLLVNDKWRWVVLLVSSLVFFAQLKVYYLILFLLLVSAISFAVGLKLGANRDESNRKQWFWSGVIANSVVLIALKYLPFLITNINSLLTSINGAKPLLVPNLLISIAVSYFVFQAISYLIDVYFEIEEPESHFGFFTLYLCFFPKLLQGPIERKGNLLPQFKLPFAISYENIRSGLLLFTWGLFKKVVVADRLAVYVNQVYDNVHSFSGPTLLIATYLYALQIFFDFSGYTDMALGSAKIFNIQLTQNFRTPYLATSIADFWRRWHISFSRWILDYIFKPLQMTLRDMRTSGTALALLVAFLVSGVWHGASWNFILWGVLHGTYLAGSTYYRPYQKKLYKWLGVETKSPWLKIWQVFITFNLVSFAWILFRANTIADAWYVVAHILSAGGTIKAYLLSNGNSDLLFCFSGLMISFFVYIMGQYVMDKEAFFRKPLMFRWVAYYVLVMSIVMLNIDSDRPFIYFRF